jgi:hypothetical protein
MERKMINFWTQGFGLGRFSYVHCGGGGGGLFMCKKAILI